MTEKAIEPLSDSGWQAKGPLAELAPQWVAALGELEEIARNRQAHQYTYADLAAVLAAVRPVLAAHGLAVFQVARTDDMVVSVTTTIMHSTGAYLVFAPLELPSGPTAQGRGSSITYARRYALLTVLGLATEDDDGATAGTRTADPVDVWDDGPPPADPVLEVWDLIMHTTDETRAQLRQLGDVHHRRVSKAALAADPEWLEQVRTVLAGTTTTLDNSVATK